MIFPKKALELAKEMGLTVNNLSIDTPQRGDDLKALYTPDREFVDSR